MRKRTAKKLRYLKNKSIWPHLIMFILSFFVGAGLVFAIFSLILMGIVQNKVNDSLRNAYKIQAYIDEERALGYEYQHIVGNIVEMAEHPLAINVIDDSNEIVAKYGDTLVLEEDEITDLSGIYYSMTDDNGVYVDTNMKINPIDLFSRMINGTVEAVKSGDAKQYVLMDIYSYEFWLNTEFSEDVESFIDSQFAGPVIVFGADDDDYKDDDDDDDEDEAVETEDDVAEADEENVHIYMKYKEYIYINDLLLLVLITICSALIFSIVVIVQFIRAISGIVYQRTILKMLLTDEVTNGKNMLAFEQDARRQLRVKQRKAMAIVDLSLMRYQNYCTLYGLEEGERLLTAIYNFIGRRLVNGEIIARSSSHDYAILLSAKSPQDYDAELTDRVKQLIEQLPEELKKRTKKAEPLPGVNNIAFSAGIYVMGPVKDKEGRKRRYERSNNIDQLLMKAEIAKQGLGDEAGVMRYNHKMWEDELWEQKVEDMMHKALENKEFQVYIQPKYHPSTEELMGGEALVRWISAEEGFISPGQFIPIFEKNGFVTKLDDYMISATAALQAKWLAEGKKIVPISVNVSRLHFSQINLAEHIRDLVDQYQLPHKYIEIELTESAFFDNKKALLTIVKKLQEYGFEVSMDDFGAGYSSLNSLKDLPLNVLKLDAEFFRGDDFDTRGEIVVSEAISLAKMLNMRIVAEGIEKKEQVDFLAKQDCDMIQGYYFAKPMPASDYESRMDSEQQSDTEQQLDSEQQSDTEQQADTV